MSTKKTGGLVHNPLLKRTDAISPADGDTRTPVDLHTRGHVDETPVAPPASEGSERASKFTFYFTPQQLERLDTAWEVMRRRGRERKLRPSKSQFVRVALDQLLDDFDQDPDKVMDLLVNQQ